MSEEADAASGHIYYVRSPAGEVTSITNGTFTGTGNPGTLVSNVVNGPHGPTSWSLGNGLTGVQMYDSLGRLNGGWVCSGTTSTYCSGGSQFYGFTLSTSGPRVTNACDTVLSKCEGYGYDSFNRLTSLTVATGTPQNFSWTYDRWGNRWAQTVTAGTGPSWSQSFNSTNNIVSSGGYTNDAAANVTYDGSHTYTYDAEGNVLEVDGGSTATYVYDALNHRVREATASGTNEFDYDYAGRRTSTWVASSDSGIEGRIYWDGMQFAYRAWDGTTYFDHKDWVGTERVRTNYLGTSVGTFYSLPYGDASTQTVTGTGADQDSTSFALLEMDPESATYHAQFRQYSPAAGRQMSPDPYSGSYDFTNPQSFNRYAYVMDNPLTFNDPSGQSFLGFIGSGGAGAGIGALCPECAGIVAAAGAIFDLYELLDGGGPSFHGSLQPRPSDPNWDGNFGESLGIPTNIPQGSWGIGLALGLPGSDCEFGGCGGGGLGFGDNPPGVPSNITINIPPEVWIWAQGQHTKVHGFWNYGNWCGPGGSGSPANNTDAACMIHDYCFFMAGASASSMDNFPNLPPAQQVAIQMCDQSLCGTQAQVRQSISWWDDPQRDANWQIRYYFTSLAPVGARCQ